MLESLRQRAREAMSHIRGLSAEESAVLALLQRRLAREEEHDRSARAAAPKKAPARAGSPAAISTNRLDLDTPPSRPYVKKGEGSQPYAPNSLSTATLAQSVERSFRKA